MKNILKVNFFFYILFLVSIFTGYFKTFITITLITIFHELGHIIIALLLNVKIEKIVIVPFGLITIFNKKINIPIIFDFLLTIMGPFFQFLLFFVIKDENILNINYSLLLFNLMPIIPLDGSKLLHLILEKLFSIKVSYNLTILISIITLISLLKYNLTILIIVIIYLFNTYKFLKDKNVYFNKFLLERYLYNYNFKITKINNINNFKKYKKHIINNQFEKDYLKEKHFKTN
jgi:stage IV sporulation protein FB